MKWQENAACRGMDPSTFYVPIGDRDTPNPRAWRAACAVCVVRTPCLNESLLQKEYSLGAVRGGMLPRQQRRLARATNKGN